MPSWNSFFCIKTNVWDNQNTLRIPSIASNKIKLNSIAGRPFFFIFPVNCSAYPSVVCVDKEMVWNERSGALVRLQCEFRSNECSILNWTNWWIDPFHLALIKEMHSEWCLCMFVCGMHVRLPQVVCKQFTNNTFIQRDFIFLIYFCFFFSYLLAVWLVECGAASVTNMMNGGNKSHSRN